MARLAVWEVLPAPATNMSQAEGEWVELLALEGGTLGGLSLSDSDGEIDFTFPPGEARPGEYIVVANGATPPWQLAPTARVFLAGKAWWTLDDRGDDVTLLSPEGQVLDQFTYGEGPAVEPDVRANASAPTPAPPPGIAVGIGPQGPGLLVPTPGGPNRAITQANSAHLALEGVVLAAALVGLVLCSAATTPSDLFGWTMNVNGSATVVGDAEVARSGCLYLGSVIGAAPLAKIAALAGGRPLASAALQLPPERAAVLAVMQDAEGMEALRVQLPAASGPGSRALTLATPCSCNGGWRLESLGPAPAIGVLRPLFDVRVVPAGPPLAAALFALLNNTNVRLDVNAYLVTSAPFVQALRQTAARGVLVRLLVEPAPAGISANDTALSPPSLRSLGDAGVWVRAFATATPNPARDHAKFLVADGRVALISTENFVGAALAGPTSNTGYAVQMDSEALAGDLMALFEWDFAGGQDLSPPRPGAAPATGPAENQIGAWSMGAVLASPMEPGPMSAWVSAVEGAHEIVQVETPAADRATLGPSSPLGVAILRAAARGVRIEMLLAGPPTAQARATESEVVAAELVAALPAGSPLQVRVDPRAVDEPSHLHAKVLVVDGRAAIVGSHNLVAAAFRTNREISVFLEDEAAAGALSQFLTQDFSQASPLVVSPVLLDPASVLGESSSADPDAWNVPAVLGALLSIGGAGTALYSLLAPFRRPRSLYSLPWRRSRKYRQPRNAPDETSTLIISVGEKAPPTPSAPEEAVADAARREEPPPSSTGPTDASEPPQTAFDLFVRT